MVYKLLTVNDFFCGCGGMGLGFIQAGFQVVGAWDFDKYAVESYRTNVDDKVKQMDISKMTYKDIDKANVWTFGFPCQDLSIAGEKKGLFEGERSGLFFEVMRLLEEARTHNQDILPEIILAENVKGLKPYLGVLETEYFKQGYRMYQTIFNSKYWGVAQNRERYFIVGVRSDIKGDFIFPEEQKEYIPKLKYALEDSVDEKFYVPDEKGQKIIQIALEKLKKKEVSLEELQTVYTDKDGVAYACNARYYKGPSYADVTKSRNTQIFEFAEEPHIKVLGLLEMVSHEHSKRVHDPDGISPTLTAVCGGTHHIKIMDYSKVRVRRLTPTEYGTLQGFPMDKWQAVVSNTQAYRQFGNAVSVPVAKVIAETLTDYISGKVQ